jgi:hypothetical protein
MTTSKISDENIIMASFDDIPEEVRKAFEERKKAREEKEMQELLACYAKDHRSSITQIKEPIHPLIHSTQEVHTTKVSDPSTSVTPEDVSTMFFEHANFTRNIVGDEVAKGLSKFSQNSKYQPTTFATMHPIAPSSSAAPSTLATQPPYGMLLNYFYVQTPPALIASVTLYMPEHVPISSIPSTSTVPGQARIMPPLAPTGIGSNTAIGVRYAAPHPPHQSFEWNSH